MVTRTFLSSCVLTAAVGVAAMALQTPARSQGIYGIDTANGIVVERAGSAGLAGPIVPADSFFSYERKFTCPAGAGFKELALKSRPGPHSVGDVAVDRATDTIWVTDGEVVMEFDQFGEPLSAFLGSRAVHPSGVIPGLITGLCFSPGVDLWITDGSTVTLVTPPFTTCTTPTTVLSFIVPAAVARGSITDLTWDPVTDTLWICSDSGYVSNVDVGPVLLGNPPVDGPGGSFLVGGAVGTGLTTTLRGIARDNAAVNAIPGTTTLYVTDGITMARLTTGVPGIGGGIAPAPPTFYTPVSIFPLAPEQFSGIAFSARPVEYGIGAGLTINAERIGQLAGPNPQFDILVRGAPPTAAIVGSLFIGGGVPAPPGTVVLGAPVWVFPLVALPLAFDPQGTARTNFTIPRFPIGVSITFQGFALDPAAGTLLSSPGLYGTLSLR